MVSWTISEFAERLFRKNALPWMFNVIAYRCSKDCDHAKRGIDCREKNEKSVKNMERTLPLMPGWERAADYHCEKLVSEREWHNRAKPARHQPVNTDAAQVRVILCVYLCIFKCYFCNHIFYFCNCNMYLFLYRCPTWTCWPWCYSDPWSPSPSFFLPGAFQFHLCIPFRFLVKWKASGTWIYEACCHF